MKPKFNPIETQEPLWEDDNPIKRDLLDEAAEAIKDAIEEVRRIAAQKTALSDDDVRHVLNEYLKDTHLDLLDKDGGIHFGISLAPPVYEDVLVGDLKEAADSAIESRLGRSSIDELDDNERAYVDAWVAFYRWLGDELTKRGAINPTPTPHPAQSS